MSDVLTLSQIGMPGTAGARTTPSGRPARSWSRPVRSPPTTSTRCSTGSGRSPPTWATTWPSRTAPTRSRSIKRSALSVIRYVEPIDWDGNEVLFALGIAGYQGGHMDILSRIAIVFSDTDEVDKLVAAQSAQELYDLLNAVNQADQGRRRRRQEHLPRRLRRAAPGRATSTHWGPQPRPQRSFAGDEPRRVMARAGGRRRRRGSVCDFQGATRT